MLGPVANRLRRFGVGVQVVRLPLIVMKKRLVPSAKAQVDPEWWESAPSSEKRRVKRRVKKREKRLLIQQAKRDGVDFGE